MKEPRFKPNIWQARVNCCATTAPVAHRTLHLHAESHTAAVAKVRTYYRQLGLQAQIHVEKAPSIFLAEAISFAKEVNAIQDVRHLSEYADWKHCYTAHHGHNSNADDAFAKAFNEALESAQA